MTFKDWFSITRPAPVCVGTGLVALDVIINGSADLIPQLRAGGSCGNVLAILAYLGWVCCPVARLKNDAAANIIFEDMATWNVQTSLMSRTGLGSTPIIVVRLGGNKRGGANHCYQLKCPNCGKFLPRYKAVLARDVSMIQERMPHPDVFYFDRTARSAIELAKISKEHGALVVFEPSGVGDKRLFGEGLEVADILKYSHEQFGRVTDLTTGLDIPLEIETRGKKGVRFRRKGTTDWGTMDAFPVTSFKDAVGSGDWCTAGIIHLLGAEGRKGLENATHEQIEEAIRFGQALAALNCCFTGTRGSMYALSHASMRVAVHDIVHGLNPIGVMDDQRLNSIEVDFSQVCPNCRIM